MRKRSPIDALCVMSITDGNTVARPLDSSNTMNLPKITSDKASIAKDPVTLETIGGSAAITLTIKDPQNNLVIGMGGYIVSDLAV